MKISDFLPARRFQAAAAVLFAVLLLCGPQIAAGQPETAPAYRFITIGSGQVSGIYYPVAQTLCRILNQEKKQPVLLASVERTRGSLYNIRAVSAGVFEFALAQSDHLAAARDGRKEFKHKISHLRTVFSLYEEIFTIVVRDKSSIRKLIDLKHRRISTGRPGSGGYATMLALFASSNWQDDDIKEINTLNYGTALDELCRNQVDAVIFTVGHPFQPLLDADRVCRLRLLPVTGPVIDRFLRQSPGYTYTSIPAGLYPGVEAPVASFGVAATLISSARVDDEIVYRVVKRVMENLDRLRRVHPVLKNLTRRQMISNCKAAPFHPGALRYYRETGLIPEPLATPNCRPQQAESRTHRKP